LCGGEGDPVGLRDGVRLRLCCGSLLAWAWSSEEEYEAWYRDPEAYHVAEPPRYGQRPFIERVGEHAAAARTRLSLLGAFYPPRDGMRVLDVGAGTGMFVEVAQRGFGLDAEGIEPCGALVRWATERGIRVRQGDWQAVAGYYRIITLFDVLEHLTRPAECLRHLRQCLEADGLLVIEMPEWGSPHQLRHGLEWRHLKPREHLWLPSRAAAEGLFRRTGYEVMLFYRPLCGSLGKATWFLGVDQAGCP
jgi:SAM-dependent methyltransferase